MKQVLFDETDRTRRLLRHGSLVLGVIVPLMAARAAERRLFVDGAIVAKGQLGRRTEMRAPLASGERLLVIADAGLASYRCRIGIE